MDKIRINLYDILACISSAQELVSLKLSNHHQQVAYLAYRLSEHINLTTDHHKDIFLAGLIHDMGAISSKEMLELIETEPVTVNHHALRGSKLFEGFKPLHNAAGIIKFHHLPWDNGKGSKYMGEEVPLASHIIHLADRVCTLFRSDRNILTQIPDILSTIREQSNTVFNPDIVEALFKLSTKEYIWLDLTSQFPTKMISDARISNVFTAEIDDIVDLALVFSRIIDFRSRFTACHSAGVAKTAERLAQLVGFSPDECKMMLIAGYLHDLGKIAISDDILEKPSKLNEDEFNEIRAHTYYTYRLLEPIEQLKTINTWASYHHEKLDGTGYPFHVVGDSIPLGARIMAVADVFTAITENRPYRQGMKFDTAKNVLNNMVASNALDGNIVKLLIDNFHEINNNREISQIEAAKQYKNFLLVAEDNGELEI
ncbi:MAG: HD domain-containing protein [Eubacteriales bacterium]|nr:HD domain-containing protein [Eubacteriales bacterium]